MTDKEKCEKLAAVAPKLSKEELAELNGLFPSYIFRRRRTREIWTTCCGVHAELPPESEIMDAAHTPEPRPEPWHGCHMGVWTPLPPKPKIKIKPEPKACPFCGKVSPVKELGRTGRRDNLAAYRRAVVLRWQHDALWAVAYFLAKKYGAEGQLTAEPIYQVHAVYRFTPGCAVRAGKDCWADKWFSYTELTDQQPTPKYRFCEPFIFNSEYGMGYDLIGADEIEKSPFRWCGFEEYRRNGSEQMRYLALCTAYSRQIEMLTKAGLVEAVVDFVERDKRNAAAFDWYAADPKQALGLNKTELSEFLSGSKDLEVLAKYKTLRRAGIAATLSQLDQMKRDLGPTWFGRIAARMKRHGLSCQRMAHYLRREQKNDQGREKVGQPISTIAGWWCDYIDVAQVLGYDLKNDVFLLPKELKKHHDKATKAAAVVQEAKRKEESKAKEAKRLRSLAPKYTYSDGRWLIRPPLNAAEIVAEGKALRHCVGGYADRHVNGTTTILFLRDRKRPGRSLVTIEMRGKEIAQIHGWDDERTACKDNPKRKSPREIYREFLDGWLAWVAAGSKRDKRGYPVLPKKDEKQSGAA